MRKESKVFLFFAVLGVGLFIGAKGFAFNQELREKAANCSYTGSMNTYCNASDGTHNLKILRCAPGEGSCYY